MGSNNPSGETLNISDRTTKKRGREAFNGEDDDHLHVTSNGNASILREILKVNKTVDKVFVDFDEEFDGDDNGGDLVSFCTSNGKPKILFSPKVLCELRHQWKNSLIVTLFGKTIDYDSVCLKTRSLWKLKEGFSVVDLGENFFLFTFQSKEDCMYVYTEGPWVVIDHFLSVRKWVPNFKPSESRLTMKTAVWVRFHEIPIEFFRKKILHSIAKSLGRPIKIDDSPLRKFARVCIEIDLSTSLCPVIEVEGKDYAVEYESLHSFCFECSHFGHTKNVNCDDAPNLEKVASDANIFESCSKPMDDDYSNNPKPKEIEIKPKETKKENGNSSDKEKHNPRQSTFWTMCPHCILKYECDRDMINKVLWCRSCKKNFTANKINGLKPNTNGEMELQLNSSSEARARDLVVKTETFELGRNSNEQSNFSMTINGGRKGQIHDSSESSDFNTSKDPEEDVIDENITEGGFKATNDDDIMKPNETEKVNGGSSPMKNVREINVESNGGFSPVLSSDGVTGPEIYEYPDPELNDFDKERGEDCFEVGQIWAVYDNLDGMPRLYALVSKIISRSVFNLRITWLDSYPDDKDEIRFVDAEFACGEFRKGNTETIHTKSVFSHIVDWEKGSKRGAYEIYPRKGETWALFKNWELNGHFDPKFKRKYEFEFVEILSGYHEDKGVSVAYLSKIKGFSSLFYRTGVDLFNIQNSQLFRFSHRVPSVRLSGEERDDVPKGSFELDPASLPSKIEEIDSPKDLETEVSYDSSKFYEITESEFFNFDAEKSPQNFQPGQFWALYGSKDCLPKCYAFNQEINHEPEFRLQVAWLSAHPTKNTIIYTDSCMPVGCGIFQHSKGDTQSYTDTKVFSHRLTVEPTDEMNEYAIYPRKGEVWAVYKNWKSTMTHSDLMTCEYVIVEILEENDAYVKAVVLEMLRGYNSVFKTSKRNTSFDTVQINKNNLLKFSHQIPAFRLTNEKSGVLKDYWELDSAALPIEMFSSC